MIVEQSVNERNCTWYRKNGHEGKCTSMVFEDSDKEVCFVWKNVKNSSGRFEKLTMSTANNFLKDGKKIKLP